MPTQLEKLKAKIQELKPDIMDFKFGCRVKYKKEIYLYLASGYTTRRGEYLILWQRFASSNPSPKYCKSLGRDINLEDILFAVEKKFSDYGIITKKTYYETFGDIISEWKWGEPIDNQSAKKINFLAKLLGV